MVAWDTRELWPTYRLEDRMDKVEQLLEQLNTKADEIAVVMARLTAILFRHDEEVLPVQWG